MTKKITLLGMVVAFSLSAYAQSISYSPQFHPPKPSPSIAGKLLKAMSARTGNEQLPAFQPQTSSSNLGQTSTNRDITQTTIGDGYYDLQTNSSVCNRIVSNVDGTVQATWTFSAGDQANDRGTGYAIKSAGAWSPPPTERIESSRTGWPNVVRTANGNEFVIAHNTAVTALQLSSRAPLGTGAWVENTTALPSPIPEGNWWPRMVTSGNYIHEVSVTYPVANGGQEYNGQDAALCYSRSSDNGATWDIVNQVPALVDSTYYLGFGGDQYAIDARGSTVAIVVGDSYTDVVLLKSTDNGNTWTKTLVWDFPIDKYTLSNTTDVDGDGMVDTLDSNDGGFSVVIDGNNMCHVAYSYMRIFDDDSSSTGLGSYFPGTNGIAYWNESFVENGDPPVLVAGAVDVDGSGLLEIAALGRYLNSGLSLHPFLASDGVNLFLSYTAVVENTADADGKNLEHVYVVASSDNGATWSTNPVDINNQYDEFSVGAFASLVSHVNNNKLELLYQRDYCAGIANNDQCNVGEDQEYVYVEADVTEFGVDMVGISPLAGNAANISAYPNPSNGMIHVNFSTLKNQVVDVTFMNSIGQVAKQFNNVKVDASDMQFDVTNLENGLYFINVKSDNGTSTIPVNISK